MEEDGQEEGDYKNDDEEGECTELRFVPQDKALLNQLFLAMNDCQALHPDDISDSDAEEEEEEGEEDDDEEYTDVPDLQIIGRGQPIYQRMQNGIKYTIVWLTFLFLFYF
jgi:Regulator of volume decrease after cellular swelling